MVAEGMSSKKISEELGLSFYTVETHRKNILNKIDINNTAELIRFAAEAGLV
jgi:DNA-binding NarL/FixJ family response regulator